MGEKQSRRDDPPFTDRGYWMWRDHLESALPVEDPAAARALIDEADRWYTAFLRSRRWTLILRSIGFAAWAGILAVALIAACAIAAVHWADRIWVVVPCSIAAALMAYRFVSTVAAARAAFRLEDRTLTRQFPAPALIWSELARKHGLEPR